MLKCTAGLRNLKAWKQEMATRSEDVKITTTRQNGSLILSTQNTSRTKSTTRTCIQMWALSVSKAVRSALAPIILWTWMLSKMHLVYTSLQICSNMASSLRNSTKMAFGLIALSPTAWLDRSIQEKTRLVIFESSIEFSSNLKMWNPKKSELQSVGDLLVKI